MKSYTKRSNCIRAARAALGNKSAKPGVDFNVVKTGVSLFEWHPRSTPAVAATKRRTTGRKRTSNVTPETLKAQPKMVEIIKHLRRPGGATVAQLCHWLGGVATHTVRGAISRLRSAGLKINRLPRGKHSEPQAYHLAAH